MTEEKVLIPIGFQEVIIVPKRLEEEYTFEKVDNKTIKAINSKEGKNI